MSNAIADAPVRANRAPKSSKAAAQITPAETVREDTEATLLVRQAAGHIFDLVNPIAGNCPWDTSSLPGWDHISESENQLWDLSKPEAEWATTGEPPRPALSDHMAQISGELHRAWKLLCAPDKFPGRLLTAQLLVDKAADLMARLQAAHSGLPGTMDDLRALATFAGVRTHRAQPRPPIRRVDGVHRYSHSQLQTALEVTAGQIATLDQMLTFLQCRGEDDAAPMVLDSAQALASHIGGMVDTLCGEEILGGMERWQFGPSFADDGKAGAA